MRDLLSRDVHSTLPVPSCNVLRSTQPGCGRDVLDIINTAEKRGVAIGGSPTDPLVVVAP